MSMKAIERVYQSYINFSFKSIYLAGKISKDDWRHRLADLSYAPQLGSCGGVQDVHEPWPIAEHAVVGLFDYAGPYFIGDDHGCFHGPNMHGAGANRHCWDMDRSGSPQIHMKPWVLRNCKRAIAQADLIFAWIDDITCYGTLAELGYAHALKKPIWIAGPQQFPDFWFVYQMADATSFHEKDVVEAFYGMISTYGHLYYEFESPIEESFWDRWIHHHLDEPDYRLVPQYHIGNYRVDFAIPEVKFAIELDGHATHSSPDAIAYDRKRQRFIEQEGWRVVRFGGKEIYQNVEACVREAADLLLERLQQFGKCAYECARCSGTVWADATHERTNTLGFCEACALLMQKSGCEVATCSICGETAWLKVGERERFGGKAYCEPCLDQMHYNGFVENACIRCGLPMWVRGDDHEDRGREDAMPLCEECEKHWGPDKDDEEHTEQGRSR